MSARSVVLTPRSGPAQFVVYWTEKFADSWFWMLGLGILHHHAPMFPALGYWVTFILVFLLTNSTMAVTPTSSTLNTDRKVTK